MRCRFDDLREDRAFELVGLERVLRTNEVSGVRGVLDEVDAAAESGAHVAGFVSYEAAPAFDDALVTRPSGGRPLVCFGVFAERVAVPVVAPPEHKVGGTWTPEIGPEAYAAQVDVIKEHIADGWTYQVNLSVGLERTYVEDPFLLYRQLAASQRSAHLGYFETDEFAICCGSPELFFSLRDNIVTARPMKGTAPRGRFAAEDEGLAETLMGSAKERAENVMIVDLIRNDLGRIATYGTVAVPDLFVLEKYPTVWQMTFTVTARLNSAVGIAEVFRALFPCGSVTGAPKSSTMRLIANLERAPRGPYCGAFGWVGPDGPGVEASFSVPIRTAVVDLVAGTARYGTGSGVTIDSLAEAEWAELVTKAAVLTRTFPSARLLETFGRSTRGGAANLEHHLDRLARSADDLGYSLDEAELRERLAALPSPVGDERVRLLVGRDGAIEIEMEPLVSELAGEIVRLGVARHPVDRADRSLFHKTTDRSRREAASRGLGDVDDVVLHNREGEVTETTRANILVRIDGRWWTPPLECGLLPGVGRALLLASGVVAERVISLDELRSAEDLETVSSLRGRRRARLV